MGKQGGTDLARQDLKPPFQYYGGKMKLAATIARLLPKHDHYVEPFAGSLAVLLAKEPSKAETVNDLDGDLVSFWRVLRDRAPELERLATLTPHSRQDYDAAKLLDADDELRRAWQVWVLLTQGRSLSMKASGWKSRTEVTATPMARMLPVLAERIVPAAERIKRVTIENTDALELISRVGKSANVCIYADPPYLGSTRARNYRHEMLGDGLHEKLAAALHDCTASVVLSGYASPLYEELFSDWFRLELKAPTALSGRKSENEIIWSNVRLVDDGAFDFSALEPAC